MPKKEFLEMKLFSFKNYYINKLRKECRRENEKAGCVYEEINGKIIPVKYCKECGKKIIECRRNQGVFAHRIKFCSKQCQRINRYNIAKKRFDWKERHRLYGREYYRNNKEKCLEYQHKRRGMQNIFLFNNVFLEVGIESDLHHINDLLVIPLPRQLHEKYTRNDREKHRNLLKPIIENIYQIDLDSLLSP